MNDPDKLDHALALDDTVFWGCLGQLADARDEVLAAHAIRLRDRRLPKLVDIRAEIEAKLPPAPLEDAQGRKERLARIKLICGNVLSALDEDHKATPVGERRVLTDDYERSPYRRFDTGRTPMNQMHIRMGDTVLDVATVSAIIAGAEPFHLCRAYIFRDDSESVEMVRNILRTELGESGHG